MTAIPFTHVSLAECHQERRKYQLGKFGETVECGKCGKSVFITAVVNGKIVRDPLTLLYSRSRRMFCDHCDHVQHWIQRCEADGTLINEIISKPAYYQSSTLINRFLREHPEAAGVLHTERP